NACGDPRTIVYCVHSTERPKTIAIGSLNNHSASASATAPHTTPIGISSGGAGVGSIHDLPRAHNDTLATTRTHPARSGTGAIAIAGIATGSTATHARGGTCQAYNGEA